MTLDGQWVRVPPEGIYVECCSCSLVHAIDFKTVKGKMYWRWKRTERRTTEARRKRKLVVYE